MSAHVSALHVYPVKGCRGIPVSSAEVDALGLVGDRRFLITDPTGKFLTQRSHPVMARIGTALTPDQLTLSSRIDRLSPYVVRPIRPRGQSRLKSGAAPGCRRRIVATRRRRG